MSFSGNPDLEAPLPPGRREFQPEAASQEHSPKAGGGVETPTSSQMKNGEDSSLNKLLARLKADIARLNKT